MSVVCAQRGVFILKAPLLTQNIWPNLEVTSLPPQCDKVWIVLCKSYSAIDRKDCYQVISALASHKRSICGDLNHSVLHYQKVVSEDK